MPRVIFAIFAFAICLISPLMHFTAYIQLANDFVASFLVNQSVLMQKYDFIIGKKMRLVLMMSVLGLKIHHISFDSWRRISGLYLGIEVVRGPISESTASGSRWSSSILVFNPSLCCVFAKHAF